MSLMRLLSIDSPWRALVFPIVFTLLGSILLGCGAIGRERSQVRATRMATIGVVGEMDSVSMSGPLLTTGIPEATRVLPTVFSSTGKVQRVETLENNHIHVEILPDDIAMKTDFIIADWNRVTVLFYWVGLQTPAPVETNIKMDTVKASLGRQVTIGYLFTESPTVVFFSSHKKPGDPQ